MNNLLNYQHSKKRSIKFLCYMSCFKLTIDFLNGKILKFQFRVMETLVIRFISYLISSEFRTAEKFANSITFYKKPKTL